MEFRDTVAARRSNYILDDDIGAVGVTEADVLDALRAVVPLVPSAFNMRSVRTVVLFGGDHRRLWKITEDLLRAKAGDRDFSSTEAKMRSFASAAGTVLFYEDEAAVEAQRAEHPRYADSFDVWSEQGIAMAQYAVWLAICDLGLAANLQHYNPLIDAEVRRAFGIPEGRRLVAQMVFGRATVSPGPKERTPPEEAVSVGRSSD